MIGLLAAAALVLLAAGLSKLRDPAPVAAAITALVPAALVPAALVPAAFVHAVSGHAVAAGRLLGALQVAAGVGVLLAPGVRPAGALVAGAFGALTLVSLRLARVAPDAACGCFGAADGPVRPLHLAVDAGLASCGVVAVVLGDAAGTGLPATLAAAGPVSGAALLVAVAVLAWGATLLLTALPELSALRRPARTASQTPTGRTLTGAAR